MNWHLSVEQHVRVAFDRQSTIPDRYQHTIHEDRGDLTPCSPARAGDRLAPKLRRDRVPHLLPIRARFRHQHHAEAALLLLSAEPLRLELSSSADCVAATRRSSDGADDAARSADAGTEGVAVLRAPGSDRSALSRTVKWSLAG